MYVSEINELFIAFCGAITALAPIVFLTTKQVKNQKRLRQLENELKLQTEAFDFGMFMREWSETCEELESVLAETNIDRFLILRSWNGELTPKWTSAVLQLRQVNQESYSYVHFELDSDYVERLRRIIAQGSIYFTVANIDDSVIKNVYENEGVTASYWAYLSTHSGMNGKSAVYTYCSFATHNNEGLSKKDITRANMVVGRLKALAMQFNEEA